MSDEDQDKMKICFDFWKEVPLMLEVEPEIYKHVVEPIPRCYILDILVEGIEEKYPNSNESRIRRALSATEIIDRLNGNEKKKIEGRLNPDEKIKRNNLYFHIEKLVKAKVLQDLTRIETGRRTTTYFARTNKIIVPILNQKKDKKDILLEHPDFKKFVKRISKENMNKVTDEEVDEVLKIVMRRNNYSYAQELHTWIRKYEPLTRDLDLDFRKLFDLLGRLARYDMKTVGGLVKLAKMLDAPKLQD